MFYAQKRINKKIVDVHRYILNPPADLFVDHINGNPLDNRRKNLRIVSNGTNIRNSKKIRPNNSSGKTGVIERKLRNGETRWDARIRVNYKIIHLGTFGSFYDAVKSRKEAEVRYWSD
jgi:hypothetical protein